MTGFRDSVKKRNDSTCFMIQPLKREEVENIKSLNNF